MKRLNVPDDFEVLYVLTSGTDLVIQNVNADPEFEVTEEGSYTVHTLVYDPNTLDLSIVEIGVTTGFDVNSLLIQGGGTICAQHWMWPVQHLILKHVLVRLQQAP